jgi:hypothetical protein
MNSTTRYLDLIQSASLELRSGRVWERDELERPFRDALRREAACWPDSEAALRLLTACGHTAADVARAAYSRYDGRARSALGHEAVLALGLWRSSILLNPLPPAAVEALDEWCQRIAGSLRGAPECAALAVAGCARAVALAVDLTAAEAQL